FETLPAERRVLVTAHDAFGYLGDRYGLEVIGVQGISTLAEAGLQDVDRVVDLVVERRIPALFVESSVPRRTVEAVVAAARERGHTVAIGGELFSDAMGAAGTPEGTYDGMVRHNVTTIVSALGGGA
ncbi:MAG: zinc ABC transporter substrate-binding protein, partial [Acidobacteriota bacterium]